MAKKKVTVKGPPGCQESGKVQGGREPAGLKVDEVKGNKRNIERGIQ